VCRDVVVLSVTWKYNEKLVSVAITVLIFIGKVVSRLTLRWLIYETVFRELFQVRIVHREYFDPRVCLKEHKCVRLDQWKGPGGGVSVDDHEPPTYRS
jgi:hypothetical protein